MRENVYVLPSMLSFIRLWWFAQKAIVGTPCQARPLFYGGAYARQWFQLSVLAIFPSFCMTRRFDWTCKNIFLSWSAVWRCSWRACVLLRLPNKLLAKRAIGRVKKFFEKALLKNPHIWGDYVKWQVFTWIQAIKLSVKAKIRDRIFFMVITSFLAYIFWFVNLSPEAANFLKQASNAPWKLWSNPSNTQ